MKRFVLGLVAALMLATAAVSAQTVQAIPTSKFGWDMPAPDLASAQGYTYRIYADGSTTAQTLAGVVCTGTASPFQCTAPIPAFTPGTHSAQLTAANIAGESAKSAPLGFTFVVTPATPTNFGIR